MGCQGWAPGNSDRGCQFRQLRCRVAASGCGGAGQKWSVATHLSPGQGSVISRVAQSLRSRARASCSPSHPAAPHPADPGDGRGQDRKNPVSIGSVPLRCRCRYGLHLPRSARSGPPPGGFGGCPPARSRPLPGRRAAGRAHRRGGIRPAEGCANDLCHGTDRKGHAGSIRAGAARDPAPSSARQGAARGEGEGDLLTKQAENLRRFPRVPALLRAGSGSGAGRGGMAS